MIEAKLRTVAKRQPATTVIVVFAGIGVDQTFSKQCLDQALEAALRGGLQGIAQVVEGDAVGLEGRSAECFAPV